MNEIAAFDADIPPADRGLDAGEAAFLARLGERVRAARREAGLSRKLLSERSGVSQRYLAQLEAGEGNISIVLLKRVADSLGRGLTSFIAAGTDPEDRDLATLYARATPEQRLKALAILDPGHPKLSRGRRIAFIGLRGAGKSTLGQLTATSTGLPFVELNREIETAAGMPVDEVMALYGQEGYRRLERQAVERVAAGHAEIVLAVAGGIVQEAETYAFLLGHFHTIWLKALPQEHMGRVRAQGDERPMAGNPAAMEALKSILLSREALYAKADLVVDTSGRTVEQSAADVRAAIAGKGWLAG